MRLHWVIMLNWTGRTSTRSRFSWLGPSVHMLAMLCGASVDIKGKTHPGIYIIQATYGRMCPVPRMAPNPGQIRSPTTSAEAFHSMSQKSSMLLLVHLEVVNYQDEGLKLAFTAPILLVPRFFLCPASCTISISFKAPSELERY